MATNDLPDPSKFPRLLDVSERFEELYRKRNELNAEATRLAGEVEDTKTELQKLQSDGFDADEAADALLSGEDPDLSDETTAGLENKIEKLERQLEATRAARSKVEGKLDHMRDNEAKVSLAAELKPDVEASSQRVAELVEELWRIFNWQYRIIRHCRSQTNQQNSHSPTGRDISGILPYALPIRSGRWPQSSLKDVLNHLIKLADEGEIDFKDPRD